MFKQGHFTITWDFVYTETVQYAGFAGFASQLQEIGILYNDIRDLFPIREQGIYSIGNQCDGKQTNTHPAQKLWHTQRVYILTRGEISFFRWPI